MCGTQDGRERGYSIILILKGSRPIVYWYLCPFSLLHIFSFFSRLLGTSILMSLPYCWSVLGFFFAGIIGCRWDGGSGDVFTFSILCFPFYFERVINWVMNKAVSIGYFCWCT